MDSFAALRENHRIKGERFGKTLSINWSIWADGGMKLDEQTEIFFKKNLGIKPLSKEAGLHAFSIGIGLEEPQLAFVEGAKEKIEKAWGLKEETAVPLKSKQPEPSVSFVTNKSEGEIDIAALVQDDLTQMVMDFLKLDAEDVSLDKILMDLGFDSIGLATFANAINDKYGIDDVTPVLFLSIHLLKK
ncbi:MAG: hypothetical protein HC896_00805 [Bacteroidales bacterium]|nr:hypothetical protein [Bacteroidales bacterium]